MRSSSPAFPLPSPPPEVEGQSDPTGIKWRALNDAAVLRHTSSSGLTHDQRECIAKTLEELVDELNRVTAGRVA